MGIVLSWHRFDTRSVNVFSFFVLFFYLFKNQNIYYNKNVLLKPLKVIVYIRIASKSAFERFARKDAACKTQAFFALLENKAQTDQKNYGTMLFMSIKSVCQKLARSCKKWKSAQKPIYALFAQRPAIVKCRFPFVTTKSITICVPSWQPFMTDLCQHPVVSVSPASLSRG